MTVQVAPAAIAGCIREGERGDVKLRRRTRLVAWLPACVSCSSTDAGPASVLEYRTGHSLMLLQSRVNACCTATATFLNDHHTTDVDISEN
jgi:hypothetical protein